jgi:hypothetical protein
LVIFSPPGKNLITRSTPPVKLASFALGGYSRIGEAHAHLTNGHFCDTYNAALKVSPSISVIPAFDISYDVGKRGEAIGKKWSEQAYCQKINKRRKQWI